VLALCFGCGVFLVVGSYECVKTIVVDNKQRVIASLRQTLNMVQTLDAAHGSGGSSGDDSGAISPTSAQSAAVGRWHRALVKVRIALKLPFLTAQAIQELRPVNA
jgi:hypothetical protein